MFARPARILVALVIFCSIAAPSAYAKDALADASQAKTSADTALGLLESIGSIRIGANSTVVTIQNGPNTHPIVIDYGQALQTGSIGVNNDGTSSRIARGDAEVPRSLPKGLTLGQIAAVLLGLAVISRVVGIVRQLVPVRSARR